MNMIARREQLAQQVPQPQRGNDGLDLDCVYDMEL